MALVSGSCLMMHCGSGPDVVKILFFGNSITELGLKPGGYVSLIEARLKRDYPRRTLRIVGAGISGNRLVANRVLAALKLLLD